MAATLLGRQLARLVQEMTTACDDHHQPGGITGGNRVAVALAASRLDHRADAPLSSQLDGVIEGEEAIAGEHGAFGLIAGGIKGNAC